LGLDPRPTAIFCASDYLAVGALAAATAHSLSVPGDVSIIGFDDVEFARHARPPLSSVRQPLHEIGSAAASSLIAQIETGKAGPTRILLPTSLVLRESTAAPRG
ncbi:MAG: substrate-binding domain-containing protein, partial [Planctomycetes bacterium]|nr:substrate-binding domain-containing protein [Planctomycetota bacterium]